HLLQFSPEGGDGSNAFIFFHHADLSRRQTCVEDGKQFLDEQLSRVNHIARQTLGFYRDHNTPETVDLAEIIEELLAIFHTRLTARQISVVKDGKQFLDDLG